MDPIFGVACDHKWIRQAHLVNWLGQVCLIDQCQTSIVLHRPILNISVPSGANQIQFIVCHERGYVFYWLVVRSDSPRFLAWFVQIPHLDGVVGMCNIKERLRLDRQVGKFGYLLSKADSKDGPFSAHIFNQHMLRWQSNLAAKSRMLLFHRFQHIQVQLSVPRGYCAGFSLAGNLF